MKWLKRIFGLAVAAALAAVAVYALLPKPVPVELGTVAKGRFEQTVDEDGRTRVRERYVVATPIAGKVLRIAFKAGDEVGEGTTLATIVATPASIIDARTRQELEQRVGAAEAARERGMAAVQRAEATLAQARADLDRSRALAAAGTASRSRLERD